MGYYFTGYSLHATSLENLRKLFENPSFSQPGEFHQRHFKPETFPEAHQFAKNKINAATPTSPTNTLTAEECAIFFDLLVLQATSTIESLSTALEVGRQVKPFLQKWLPIALNNKEIADQMMTGGAWGLKGTAPFEFGHFGLKDLSVHDWDDYVGFLEKFTPEQLIEITQDYAIGDLLTDTMAISFQQAVKALKTEFPHQSDALIICAPFYIHLIHDEDDAHADIPK